MRYGWAFSPDYVAARSRFRDAAARAGWELEAHPVGVAGPAGDDLTVDVARTPVATDRTLVVSSGLHGVEGFFGSAVQLALLEHWRANPAPPVGCVLVHGLNPAGFAHLRRFDENNVDPNRNFLLPGERYEGAPAGYAEVDALLNPERRPSRWEPFLPKAAWAIARYGLAALRQTVAAGQYDFPRGLFYGGAGPSRTNLILAENLGRWVGDSRAAVHLDFHTGLGPYGSCKLLIDYPLDARQRANLTDWFGAGSFEECSSSTIAYDTRGGFGPWCVSRRLAADYYYACAEFGTYGPVRMLAGLRAENQAHHWGSPAAGSTARAKARLKELFCPAAESWRSAVVARGLKLVEQAVAGLLADPSRPVPAGPA